MQLLELAHDTQEELRHLVRLLSNSHQASAAEILEYAVKVHRRTDAVTAGVVLMARRRGIPWQALGQILNISPETARHTYHERHVQRRLDQYRPLPDPPAPVPDPAPDDDNDPGPAKPAARGPSRAGNQLAPILSRMQIASGIPLRQLGLRAQVSASYLSRVLSGEKFPTWDLTEKIAVALGADSAAVHKVWQDERERTESRATTQPSASRTAPQDSRASLSAALRTLHMRAGRPTARTLSARCGHRIGVEEICGILHGRRTGTWEQVSMLIWALDGQADFFRQHWEEAQQSASDAPPSAPETTDDRLEEMLTTFGGAFQNQRTVPLSPELGSRHRALRRRLAQAALAREVRLDGTT
ncbi:helix-turn-helix transcriptional regulator [Streptomyces sp. NPDC005727]|uniref:helix-turn-helix domain-containing protein n=1 Tax=Streptomyces sp. NPDC005727 TaxID=3157053 RepID=UPI0033F5497A